MFFSIFEKNRMAAHNERLLHKINSRFEELYETYGEPPENFFSESQQISLGVDIQSDLSIYGIHFTSFKEGSQRQKRLYQDNLHEINKAMHLFIYETSEPTEDSEAALASVRKTFSSSDFDENELRLAGLCSRWNSTSGFGNSSFRFLYGQFTDAESPKYVIAGEPVEFSYNPFHKINLDLLASLPEVWTSLKEVYTETNPMVSWDSQKVRFWDKSFKNATLPTLTKRHRDIYAKGDGTELDRKQAMIIFERPKPKTTPVSLGFVLFSNDRLIRKYIAMYFGKEGKGFSSVEDEKLNVVLDKWWRTLKNGLVVWDQSTIHYEGVPQDIASQPYLRKLATDVFGDPLPEATLSKGVLYHQHLSEPSFRAVVGTHTPHKLTQEDLVSLASLAIQDRCPEIYTKNRSHNKGSIVDSNVVNHKSTQFMRPRPLKKMERTIPIVDHSKVEALPGIYKEFYGIYDPDMVELSTITKMSILKIEEQIRTLSTKYNISPDEFRNELIRKYQIGNS